MAYEQRLAFETDKSPTPDDTEGEEKVLRGVIKRVTFRNAENGYTVLQLTAPGYGDITVVGTALNISSGSNIIARGEFERHPKFGKQFKASSILETLPSSSDDIEKYLGSGLIKGIGDKTAKKIVATFGEQTLQIIEKDPEQIASIEGVGRHKADILHKAILGQSESRETMRFLIEHNISEGLAHKIWNLYGNRTIEMVTKNPYRLARDIWGVGFATADSIAFEIGIKKDAPHRLKAGLTYALEKATEEGHCFLPVNQLSEKSRILLGLDETQDLSEPLNELIDEGFLVALSEKIFLPNINRAEELVANFVASRVNRLEKPILSEIVVEQAIMRAQQELQLTFSDEQKQTVRDAVSYPLMVITGGPGCGKTTIIRALSSLFRTSGLKLVLCAPTGRAAQRMAEVCDMKASTIHRLLKFDPSKRTFLYGPDQPLFADVIIIDESSMIDISLAMHLFSAIPEEAIVILVGDKDQLPSVGPGKVLSDIITTKEVKTTFLSKLFRREHDSSINGIAHMINSGQLPDIPTPDGIVKTDAYFIPKKDPEEACSLIENLYAEQIPRKFGIKNSDIFLLTPSNRGPLGTVALNQRLQNRINPKGKFDSEQEILIGATEYRVGDRVCQRVNNYNLGDSGVFNGDIGTIQSISRRESNIVVEMWDGRLIKYDRGDAHQLSLAYSMTVHRSQGSEMPCVILALHDSHFTLLERQLIYTAVTRAKKLLVIVGSKRALAIGCKKMSTRNRCTMLGERIHTLLS